MNLRLNITLQKGTFALQANIEIPWKKPSTHVIFGASGVGKTHLLRSICGLDTPKGFIQWQQQQKADIWLDHTKHINAPSHQRHVAMVFQDGQLFSHLNVEQNLRFAFDRAHATEQDWEVCIQALGLTPLLQHQVHQLSGGQAQRVALARAILSKPKLLILDEPLASLDWQSKQDVMSYLKQLNQQWQLPVLYVTHDVNEVLTLADHVIMLEQESDITRVMPPRALIEILQDEQHPFYGMGKSSILVTLAPNRTESGLLHVPIGEQIIRLPHTQNTYEQQGLRLCIAASDVSLTLSPTTDSSIVNILQGQVSRIEKNNTQQYLIQLNIEGQFLLSEISAYSFERLNIKLGQNIYAQIKGIALQQSA